MKRKTKLHPLQITIDNFLACQVFTKAEQIWIQEMYFGDNPIPTYTGSMGYATITQDWNERQAREYYIFLQIETLLKRIARHRKIKQFKPKPYEIYHFIDGKIKFEHIMKGDTHATIPPGRDNGHEQQNTRKKPTP